MPLSADAMETPTPTTVLLQQTVFFVLKKEPVKTINIETMEWYVKNRWWIWSITGLYLGYRILTGIFFS